MIQIQIKELIASRSHKWGRKVTVNEIAHATGISRMTLSRMMRFEAYSTVTDHLDKLCDFFDCEVQELVKRTTNKRNCFISSSEYLRG
jgi:putative transcriptional regulator